VKELGKLVGLFLLVALAGGFVFGFMAAGEPGADPRFAWRIFYGGLLVIITAVLLLLFRRK
jgi:hypothetical protein